ncbi:MAG: hypothetical protein EU532_01985 [Promethearchaeota archaeon]|nr:MAG: hypothetical protein EU532_01985 [Candidatus Lokiarchaeota archaeon]
MSIAEWKKVEFQQFAQEFGTDLIIKNAPPLLYPKKDIEHEAYNSLIAFFLVAASLCIYTSISLFLMEFYFNVISFIIIILVLASLDLILLFNYIKSKVYIKPIECWIEIYNYSDVYCLSYYPVFTGKSLPNKAKDIIYKLYRQEVLKTKIDITQIELYLKISKNNFNNHENLGFFFPYGKGKHFRDENINRNSWQYFPFEQSLNENFIAIANWDHQFEWRLDLNSDFDKLNEYSPWIIKKWNVENIKPLTEDYKKKLRWNLRCLDSAPKLKPWKGDLVDQTYENEDAYKDLEIIEDAIEKIMGKGVELNNLKDLEQELLKFKIYFRDLQF